MSSEITLLQAWHIWLSGSIPPTTVVMGLELFKWVRIGKCLQFLGVITLVSDIIGVERIRNCGISIRKIYSLQDALLLFPIIWKEWLIFYTLSVKNENSQEHINARAQLFKSKFNTFTTLLMLFSSVGYFGSYCGEIPLFQLIKNTFLIAFFIPVVMIIMGFLLALILFFVAIFLELLARLISHHLWIKLFTLLSISIGFHFVLLGS